MNYLVVQLFLVGINFTLHLFFSFFCGILRFKWVSSKLCLSSMIPCCATTLCYSEGCVGGLSVSALLIFKSLWIYLRISETDKSLLSFAESVMASLLGPWTMKGGCIKETGEVVHSYSGCVVWLWLRCTQHFYSWWHKSAWGIHHFPPVKYCSPFWNQGESARQR